MDSLDFYKRKLSKSELLSPEEEKELSKKIKNGCEQSFEKFINSNLRLVFKIANSYRLSGIDFMDLVSEGNIGLCKAAKKFNPERGTRFSTYASFWIKQRILKYINNHGKTIRIPTYLYPLLKKVKETQELLAESESEITVKEINKKTQIPETKIRQILPHTCAPTSIDLPIGEGSETLQDVLVSSNAQTSLDSLILNENFSLVREAIESLTEREKYIIRKRFGLDGGEKETLENVGKTLHLTRERIRQIESIALSKMKNFLRKKNNIVK